MSWFLDAADKLLRSGGEPLSSVELIRRAKHNGLIPDTFKGATPEQTMKSKLSVEVRRHGDRSRFVRTAPGRFFLRELLEPNLEVYAARAVEPPKPTEDIVSFPSKLLDQIGRFQGIRNEGAFYLDRLRELDSFAAVPRLEAEFDDSRKQVLCYVMVSKGSQILAYRRGTYNRVEDFLKGCQCVGFGGHVSASDVSLFDPVPPVYECVKRELREELKLPDFELSRLDKGEGLSLLGVLNDDSSPVGRRHFAFVFRFELSLASESERVERREQAIAQLRWLSLSSEQVQLEDFEYWSQLCLLQYYPALIEGKPNYTIQKRRRSRFKPPRMLCILGPVGSGKTEATKLVTSEFGYTEINSGKVLAKILSIRAVTEKTRASFQRRAQDFITSETGPTLLANALVDAARAVNTDRVLIDGIRHEATLREVCRLLGGELGVIYVHTPPNLAFEFYKERDASRTFEDFIAVREHPVESEVQGLIRQADVVLYNWRGKEGYQSAIRELMKEILGDLMP